MKKSELKTGYVVEDRRGHRGIVMLNTPGGDIVGGRSLEDLMSKINSTWYPLDSMKEDLKSKGCDSRYDIVKVYGISCNSEAISLSRVGDLLWKRKEIKQYTMKELEEIVGHEFKIKKA